jgi:hypothetical protein
MRVHFCASRFLLKVLATLASGSERQRVTAQFTVLIGIFSLVIPLAYETGALH